MDALKNLFINQMLKRMLDGKQGSTLLGAVVAGILAMNIDYVRAIAGFQFEDPAAVAEAAKLAGGAVALLWGFLIGRKERR